MKKVLSWIFLFVGFSFVGPILTVTIWPPSQYNFLYSVIYYVWPTWILSVYEATIGSTRATILAVLSNAVLYAAVGLIAAAAENSRLSLWVVYVGFCMLLTAIGGMGLEGWWGISRFDSLAVMWAIIALPFILKHSLNRLQDRNANN